MSSPGLHAWLMSERPASRRQAALGRAYGTWRSFARNRLALLSLAIVFALVLMAIFSTVITTPGLRRWLPEIGVAVRARG